MKPMLSNCRWPADWKSAIQQVGNLRYTVRCETCGLSAFLQQFLVSSVDPAFGLQSGPQRVGIRPTKAEVQVASPAFRMFEFS